MMAEKILLQQTKEYRRIMPFLLWYRMQSYLPLEDLVEFEQEMERLQKEEEEAEKSKRRAEGMLNDVLSTTPEAKHLLGRA